MDAVKLSLSSPALPHVPSVTRVALDTFFRSFGFTTDEDLSRLAAWVLDASGAESRDAVALARARMEDWLAEVLGPAHTGGSLLTRGRAAFVLCEGARRGAAVITAGVDALPADFTRALRAAVPVPVPVTNPTTMPEQNLVLSPLGELFRRWWRSGQPDVSISS